MTNTARPSQHTAAAPAQPRRALLLACLAVGWLATVPGASAQEPPARPPGIDVVSASQELPMPPHIDAKQVEGFGLFTLKAIVNGRGTELLDMAPTSLLR